MDAEIGIRDVGARGEAVSSLEMRVERDIDGVDPGLRTDDHRRSVVGDVHHRQPCRTGGDEQMDAPRDGPYGGGNRHGRHQEQ